MADRLEAKGLVERRTDPGDRRFRAVALTPKGEAGSRSATRAASGRCHGALSPGLIRAQVLEIGGLPGGQLPQTPQRDNTVMSSRAVVRRQRASRIRRRCRRGLAPRQFRSRASSGVSGRMRAERALVRRPHGEVGGCGDRRGHPQQLRHFGRRPRDESATADRRRAGVACDRPSALTPSPVVITSFTISMRAPRTGASPISIVGRPSPPTSRGCRQRPRRRPSATPSDTPAVDGATIASGFQLATAPTSSSAM
jgi:hypothetical protein